MDTNAANLLTLSLGLMLLRVVIGFMMAAHGAQKLLGWFGGPGLGGTGKALEQIGFHPGRAFAALASITEIGSGLLVAFGLLGPIGPALMISVMIVAAIAVHWKNGLISANGIEMPLLYATAALGLAFTGFGQYSLDAALGIAGLWSAPIIWAALAVGIVGGIANLGLRRRPAIAVQA